MGGTERWISTWVSPAHPDSLSSIPRPHMVAENPLPHLHTAASFMLQHISSLTFMGSQNKQISGKRGGGGGDALGNFTIYINQQI